jgi:glycerol-3-phosphate acyltransferase PlsY
VKLPVAVTFVVLVGYLLGSIPVAALVTRRDLRTVGDRNPGYWNARETLGRRAAVPVFVGDVAKGAAAAAVGLVVAGLVDTEGLVTSGAPTTSADLWWLGYVGGGAAMVGHAWPVFAGFRGGRSILTFTGTVVVVAPVAAAIAIGACVAVTLATRRFAFGARVGVFGFPVVQILVEGPYRTAATGCLMCVIGLRFAMAAWADRRSLREGDLPPDDAVQP